MHGGGASWVGPGFGPAPERSGFKRDPYISKYPMPGALPFAAPAAPSTAAEISPRLVHATWAVIAAALVGLIASFAMHLVNLRMQNLGISGALISLSVAIQALAICISALAAKRIILKVGLQPTLPISGIACAVTLVAVFFESDVYRICALRFLFAVGLSFLLIASEYLVTARSKEVQRPTLIAWYTTAIAAGAVLGPLLINFFEVNELASFLIGVSVLMFASVLLCGCLSPNEGMASRGTSCFSLVAFMPAAFMAAFVFGIADNGGLSMLSVYGALNSYDNASAANLAVFAAVGGMFLQFPIAWLASKRSTTELLFVFSVIILGLLAILPFVLGHKPSAFLVAAGLGGLIEGFYTLGLIAISRDRRANDFSSLNACFISICSLGEVIGPVAGSISMHHLGPSGIIAALAFAFGLYALGILNRFSRVSGNRNTFN